MVRSNNSFILELYFAPSISRNLISELGILLFFLFSQSFIKYVEISTPIPEILHNSANLIKGSPLPQAISKTVEFGFIYSNENNPSSLSLFIGLQTKCFLCVISVSYTHLRAHETD